MKRKHQPSGIIIVWLGNDNKAHTRSIPFSPNTDYNPELGKKLTLLDAQEKLSLLQLDYMGKEYLCNSIKSPPMITTGLTRKEARQALLKELHTETPKPLPSGGS